MPVVPVNAGLLISNYTDLPLGTITLLTCPTPARVLTNRTQPIPIHVQNQLPTHNLEPQHIWKPTCPDHGNQANSETPKMIFNSEAHSCPN